MTRYMEPLPGHYDASDPFGHIRDNGKPHLGSDYNGVPAGTPFAICASGTVVINQWSSVLGWVLGVHNDDGKFMGYAHQLVKAPHTLGDTVSIGETGGQVGDTGSASNGAHLHISLGDTIDAIFGVGVQDPYAYIIAHLTDTAGTGGTPITGDEPMKRFITATSNSPWYVTDGMTKRILAPNENQLLVDLGLAVYEVGPIRVKIIGQQAIDRIPTLK